jgi:DNA-binding XRE family transcriptional regulator
MPVDEWNYLMGLCGWDEPTKIAGITRSDLRARREKMGLSQRQLAGLLALSEKDVVKAERERAETKDPNFNLAFGHLSQVIRLAIERLETEFASLTPQEIETRLKDAEETLLSARMYTLPSVDDDELDFKGIEALRTLAAE